MSLQDAPADRPFIFNPHDPAYNANPYPTYRYLRENAPAYYWAAGKAWVFSRYEDVAAAMANFRRVAGNSPFPPQRLLGTRPARFVWR